MTDEQKAAYVFSQSAMMLVELEAMKAANAVRERGDMSPAFGEKEFMDLQDRYSVGHNYVIGLFNS